MNFSSLSFFCFFFIFYIIYWLLPRRTFRQCFLLLGSAIFCGWLDIYFFLLLFGAASICYFAGMFIAKGKSQAILVIAISLLLANLAFFKYFNFFSESFSELLHFVGLYANTNTLDIILPIGISFYTFQAISYIVDVFQRKIAPEKNFLKLILYFSFFPRFIAGPIVRADDFLPQLSRDVFLKSRDFTIGVKLFLQGFIYKSIFADNMAPFIDKVYAKVTLYNNLTLTMATIGNLFFK